MSTSPFGERLGAVALRYVVELGFPVFPLTPRGKHPLHGSGGVHDASSHPEQIGDWWDAHPDANIGLACGAASGLFVLDVDGAEGERALSALGAAACRTIEQRTSKGRHRFFRAPGVPVRNSVSRLGPALDVRGDGGYVVVPPSVHPSGFRYSWTFDPFTTMVADAPAELLEALASIPTLDAPPVTSPLNVPPIQEGDRLMRAEAYVATVSHAPAGLRNATCYRVAAALVRDFALGEAGAWGMLVAFNAGRCMPPLGARELRLCLRSAIRHGRKPEGAAFLNDRSRDPFAGRRAAGGSW